MSDTKTFVEEGLGLCDLCHGPLVWTMADGEMWTACERDCSGQGELFGLPTLYAKGDEFARRHWEPSREEGVAPPEGGAASETDRSLPGENEPPVGWLSALWQGGWDGQAEDS